MNTHIPAPRPALLAASVLLPLSLAACQGQAEQGIDRTFVRGTVSIPPGAVTEAEATQGDNDTPALAEDFGFVSTRYTVISGTCLEYDSDNTPSGQVPTGDEDYYRFTPLKSGTMALSLLYPDTPATEDDPEPSEKIRYFVTVYDLNNLDTEGNPTVLLDGDTSGSYSAFSADISVTSGNAYAVRVAGIRNTAGDSSYQLVLSGFDPNGAIASPGAALEPGWSEQDGEIYTTLPTRFIVGAYEGQEIDARGLPLGGSDVPSFTLDPETLTWSGEFEITYVYAARIPEDLDSADSFAGPEVTVGYTEVALFAGSFPSLNAGVTSGTIFSSSPTVINLDDAVAEDFPAGWIGVAYQNRVLEGVEVVCDVLQPKLYGWSEVEVEPNDFADQGDGYTIGDVTGAQVLPVATGAGYVDTVTGALDFTSDAPQWAEAPDAFAITVPETLDAYISVSWPDASYNLDVNFYDSTGALIAAGWNVADSNPEAFSALGDYGFTLEPGETYYLALFGWTGVAASSVDYTIEIEWLAP